MVLLRPLVARVLFIRDWFKRCQEIYRPDHKQQSFSLHIVTSVFVGLLGFAVLALPPVAIAAPMDGIPPASLAVAGGSMFHFAGDRPTNIGVVENHLQTCPDSPNCVSSQSLDEEHHVEPIELKGNSRRAMQALKHAIDDSERAEVVKSEDNYLYAEFTSKLMGFVDDVEFYINEDERTIEVRSASRMGESDLGVNRKRVEAIRQKFWTLLQSESIES